MRPAVHLHQERQASVRRGHPWIFPKAISRQTGKVVTGELVHILGMNGESLGVGIYNEHSLYRVRVLALDFENIEVTSFSSLISKRIIQALQIRQALLLPNATTNAYRVFNSEGDGLSGLTIDRFHNTCVVSSSAYWVELHRDVICGAISDALEVDKIIWRSEAKSLAQDGWKNHGEQPISGTEQVLEGGVSYQIEFSTTQKTGLFLDQRENHQRIAALASGKRVLDLYTYTGGFALHAAMAGALQVTAVDSSAQAIDLANRNASLNQIDTITFIKADARDYVTQAGDYDLVVLDPPKLAPSQKHLERAKNYYRFLHQEVFKSMQSGSILMTCNCSSALSAQEFTTLVSAQASAVGKIVRILGVFGPASCHPILAAFPEGHYLTAVLLAVI